MPELPDVEVVRCDLERSLVGSTVRAAECADARLARPGSPGAFARALLGRTCKDVVRRGKWLRLELDDGTRSVLPPGDDRRVDARPDRRAPAALRARSNRRWPTRSRNQLTLCGFTPLRPPDRSAQRHRGLDHTRAGSACGWHRRAPPLRGPRKEATCRQGGPHGPASDGGRRQYPGDGGVVDGACRSAIAGGRAPAGRLPRNRQGHSRRHRTGVRGSKREVGRSSGPVLRLWSSGQTLSALRRTSVQRRPGGPDERLL